MPPDTQRRWSADEIGFAIRDWLLTFGRLPRREDWRPNALPLDLSRYGALRGDGRARWPSGKSVRRCFHSWEHAHSYALTGSFALVLRCDPDATQVNIDEAAQTLMDRARMARAESVLRADLGDRTADTVTGLLFDSAPVTGGERARPYIPAALTEYRPRLH